MKNKTLYSAALSATACLLACFSANASHITIDDTSPNDTITIAAGQFEFGFFVDNVLIQQGLGTGSITVPETAPVTFSGTWIDNGVNAPVTRVIYLVEQNDPTQISDILQLVVTRNDSTSARIQGTFTSDINGNLGTLPIGTPAADVFVEGSAEAFLFSFAFLTGDVRSDVDTVPDSGPGAIGLLTLLGLCGLGYRRHLRCQTNAS